MTLTTLDTHTPAAPVSLDTARLIAAKLAPTTRRNYESALTLFAAYLDGRPPCDAALADYLALRHQEGLAPGSLAMVVAACRFLEREGNRRGELVGPLTVDTLAGIRREGRGRGRGQVSALSREAVAIVAVQLAERGTVAGCRDAALLRVMSDALLRIGEAVAIDCEHVQREADGSGRLTIAHSKTDQEGRGAVQYLTPRTVQAIDTLQKATGYTKGPLFRRIRRGDHCTNGRLSVDGARQIIQNAAKLAGIDGASGHSLRIGTAQELAHRGASLVELQTAGRWQSPDMPAHYTRRQEAGKGAVARLLGDT